MKKDPQKNVIPIFMQGSIRPPTEAHSLLLRFTENCPWNHCSFCGLFKDQVFKKRSIDSIKKDIDLAKETYDYIHAFVETRIQQKLSFPDIISDLLRNTELPESFRSTVLFYISPEKNVFLQDANSIVLPTEVLVELIVYIKHKFPLIKNITIYGRSDSILKKSLLDLKELCSAGLTRIDIGMESGCDLILKKMNKGITSGQTLEAGNLVIQAGLELHLCVMPGLAGADFEKHALKSAQLINQLNASYLRLRSLFIRSNTPLANMIEEGSFLPANDDLIVQEIKMLLENLSEKSLFIDGTHRINLLQEIEGALPQDKQNIIKIIDKYLSLSPGDRLLFRFARAIGTITHLDDLLVPEIRRETEKALYLAKKEFPEQLESFIKVSKTARALAAPMTVPSLYLRTYELKQFY